MDSQYSQFTSSDHTFTQGEPRMAPPSGGMKRIVVYILYGVLVVLLLILMMITGIKFSQLKSEISEVKVHLERMSHAGHGGSGAGAGSSGAAPPEVLIQKITPVRGSCREGWVAFQSTCYLLSTNQLTWRRAEDQCKTHGGHLLVVNTEAELDYLSAIVEIRNEYWIGLVERTHEGHWTWVDGTDFSTTPNFWDVDQPDNWDYRENGEDCGQFHSTVKRKRKLMNDADCNLLYHYICEARA